LDARVSNAVSSLTASWIAGGFALGGVALTTVALFLLERVRRDIARDQWLLDRQHEVSTEIVDRAAAADSAIMGWMLGSGLSESDLETELQKLSREIRSAHGRLRLLIPLGVAETAKPVVAAAEEMVFAMAENKTDLAETLSREQAAMHHAVEAFIEAVQHELGVARERRRTRGQ
jgi:hypothetical protein